MPLTGSATRQLASSNLGNPDKGATWAGHCRRRDVVSRGLHSLAETTSKEWAEGGSNI